MGKFFRISGAILTGIGLIGILGLVFNIGINVRQYGVVTTWGIVESMLVLGLILQILYKVTEMEL
jgi:hypothetical protein